MLILVIYYKKFDSDCQSHSDDSINLKGLSVLKTSPFLFISRSFFIRTISIQYIFICVSICVQVIYIYIYARIHGRTVLAFNIGLLGLLEISITFIWK